MISCWDQFNVGSAPTPLNSAENRCHSSAENFCRSTVRTLVTLSFVGILDVLLLRLIYPFPLSPTWGGEGRMCDVSPAYRVPSLCACALHCACCKLCCDWYGEVSRGFGVASTRRDFVWAQYISWSCYNLPFWLTDS